MKWPKYWSFSFSIIPSKEIPGLISFRMDWLDLLAVQGTLKSLLQNHSSKASILRHSAFFTVQFSHPYMTTGKTIALTRRTFVGKVMSLFFNNFLYLWSLFCWLQGYHFFCYWCLPLLDKAGLEAWAVFLVRGISACLLVCGDFLVPLRVIVVSGDVLYVVVDSRRL